MTGRDLDYQGDVTVGSSSSPPHRPHWRFAVLVLALVSVVAGGFRFNLKPVEIESVVEMTPTEATTAALGRISMPRFSLEDATLSEALAQLQTAAYAGGLPKGQFRFRYVPPEELPTPPLRWVKVRAEIQPDGSERVVEEPADRVTINGGRARADVFETRISVRLTSIPLGEAIKYVASLSDLKSRIEGNEVCLYQADAIPRGPMIFRRKPAPPGRWVQVPPGADRVDLRPALQGAGVRLCEGARVEYLPNKQVVLMLLPKELDEEIQESIISCGVGLPPSYLDRIRAYLPSWLQF